ncbi:hypothetical protein [Epilithonimonas vandammei]|nr:hypothetical protein [Epilithonimonas vandammei]
MRVSNAQLRYYFHISEPDALTDEEWIAYMQELEYIRKLEAKKYE